MDNSEIYDELHAINTNHKEWKKKMENISSNEELEAVSDHINQEITQCKTILDTTSLSKRKLRSQSNTSQMKKRVTSRGPRVGKDW